MTLDVDFRRVLEADGIPIALTGMVIVFLALTLISLAIAALPRVLRRLQGILPPESEEPHARPQEARATAGRSRPRPEAVVAIARALLATKGHREG